MAECTKTIIFRSENLGKDTTLMLTFNSGDIPGIYRDTFPIVWKVAEFAKFGQFMFRVRFKLPLGVSVAQLNGGGVVSPLAYIPINLGEQTSLLKDNNEYCFSTPKPFSPDDSIAVKNETTGRENFGVGIFEQSLDYPPSTLWLYKDIGSGSNFQIQFRPILRGYVTSDFQVNDILRGQVTSPVIFEQDLTKLDDETYWKITFSPATNSYRVEREEGY